MSSSELDPKILAKIKKCLALATSDNPNEAATAMRQAHALMSKHGLTAEAITQADIGEAQTASRTMARNKPSKWEAALAGLVANAFGCRMLIASMVPKEDAELPKRSQGVFNVGKYIFVGLKNQVEIAAYTAQVLTRKCQKARAAWIKEKCSGLQKKPGGRKQATALGDEFAMGWVWQISQLVQDFAHQPEIERAIDRYIEAKSAGEADESTVRSSKARKSRALSSALFAGIKAAQGEQLHRPVHAPVSQALLEF